MAQRSAGKEAAGNYEFLPGPWFLPSHTDTLAGFPSGRTVAVDLVFIPLKT